MMKETTRAIFDYIREHDGEDMTAKSIAEALGLTDRQVTGSVNSFVKKEWAYREEGEPVMENGKAKAVKYIVLTELGKTVDPDATEAA